MIRAALYARYSTDNQRVASIADQQHGNRHLAGELGAHVVREFSDAALSGQTLARPDFQAMMAMVEAGEIDLIIAEHTDRLTRDGGHIYDIYYELKARDVRLVTVHQGEIGLMHVGTSGLMSAMFIEELKKKVRRGLEGVVREGRYTGQPAYGYQIARELDAKGDRKRGLRTLHPDEAPIVHRIFEMAASGMTSGEIAEALNTENVPTRSGGKWHKAAILGSTTHGTGILRNELYRGRLVWGRTASRRDRRTGRRRIVENPAERQVRDAPELRIVTDDLWERAHRQVAKRSQRAGQPRAQRRGPTLLGSLVRCANCGSRMVFTGQGDFMRCAQRTQHQVDCGNTRTPHYADVEARILAHIKANFLHPDVVADAAREWQRAEAEARAATQRDRADLERALADAERRMARLIAQVEDGMPWSAIAARHAELEAKAGQIRAALAEVPPAPVTILHPSAANLFRLAVEDLTQALDDPADTRTARAREGIRALIDDVTVRPCEGRGKYHVEVIANLAPILDPAFATMSVATIH